MALQISIILENVFRVSPFLTWSPPRRRGAFWQSQPAPKDAQIREKFRVENKNRETLAADLAGGADSSPSSGVGLSESMDFDTLFIAAEQVEDTSSDELES